MSKLMHLLVALQLHFMIMIPLHNQHVTCFQWSISFSGKRLFIYGKSRETRFENTTRIES
jgi:hypothetical protein